jgi:hypothetical protein
MVGRGGIRKQRKDRRKRRKGRNILDIGKKKEQNRVKRYKGR